MQRDIKFRAWDEYTSQMVYQDDVLTASKILNRYDVVEQFTGVCDRNGKEIYEGDFIYFDSGYEQEIGIVEYNTDDYCPQFCIVYNYGNILDFSHRITKVVGNVFENPEYFNEGLI